MKEWKDSEITEIDKRLICEITNNKLQVLVNQPNLKGKYEVVIYLI